MLFLSFLCFALCLFSLTKGVTRWLVHWFAPLTCGQLILNSLYALFCFSLISGFSARSPHAALQAKAKSHDLKSFSRSARCAAFCSSAPVCLAGAAAHILPGGFPTWDQSVTTFATPEKAKCFQTSLICRLHNSRAHLLLCQTKTCPGLRVRRTCELMEKNNILLYCFNQSQLLFLKKKKSKEHLKI